MAWRLIGTSFSLAARTGKCTVCGTDQKADSGVLTTDVFISGEGDIEICASCIREGASLVGMIEEDKAVAEMAELATDLAEMREWAETAYIELSAKDATIESLSTALGKVVAERDALAEPAAKYEDLCR